MIFEIAFTILCVFVHAYAWIHATSVEGSQDFLGEYGLLLLPCKV